VAEVIGVVPDLKDQDMRERAHSEIVMLSNDPARSPWILARVQGSPGSFLASLQNVAAGIDPGLPVAGVQTMSAELDDHVIEVRASMQWLGVFAAIALGMAAMGIYGVISYTVALRRQEIGVRMALGAARHQIARMVIVQTARLAAIGLAIGLALSALATRALSAALYGVSPMDPITFSAAGALLFLIALLAVIAPLRASAAVDPAEALRYD
jgi:putative ABC transport system permease protein